MKLRNLINLKALKEQPSYPTQPIADFMGKNIDKLDKLRTTSKQEPFAHTPGLHQKDYSEQTPLEVQAHDDNQLYYIDTEYIEAYIHGDTVTGIDPDRGHEDKELNRDNSDATQGGLRAQGFADTSAAGLVPGDPNWPGEDDRDNFPADPRMDPAIRSDFDDPIMEDDVDEGTCGYGKKGKLGKKPAGPHLITKSDLQETLQRRAGIIK